VRGILSAEEIDALVERARAHGGLVSWRDNGDGTRSAYELNTTWYSALNRDDAGEGTELQVSRFIATRAIALALRGVPGVYLPSVFGARNDTATVLAGAEARSINRKAIDEDALYALLEDRSAPGHQVAQRTRRLVTRRIRIPAFHPNAEQRILALGDAVFAVLRATRDGGGRVLALTNVTAREQRVSVPLGETGATAPDWRDALSGRSVAAGEGRLDVALRPYGVLWLEPAGP
jgi:sucrose phosphorylase